jgi:hypothetical protein
MEHGGRRNGELKAPHHQLIVIGIPKNCVMPAIREAEALGLLDCHRGGMRVATTFGLTWLPLHDGTALVSPVLHRGSQANRLADRCRTVEPQPSPWPALLSPGAAMSRFYRALRRLLAKVSGPAGLPANEGKAECGG